MTKKINVKKKYITILLYVLSSTLLASPIYNQLWQSTLEKHSQVTFPNKIETIIVNKTSLNKSQTFNKLMRYYLTTPLAINTDDSRVFFINKTNIKNIIATQEPYCQTLSDFNQTEQEIIQKDPRILFALGGPSQKSPNIYAFNTQTLNTLLDTALKTHLKKSISLNKSKKTIKISTCFVKQIPDEAVRLNYIQSLYPTKDLSTYTIYHESFSQLKK